MKVLSLASHDSQINFCIRLLSNLPNVEKKDLVTFSDILFSNSISNINDYAANNFDKIIRKYSYYAIAKYSFNYDIVIISLLGPNTLVLSNLIRKIGFKKNLNPPFIISGFVGLNLNMPYKSISDRILCDLVLLNNKYEKLYVEKLFSGNKNILKKFLLHSIFNVVLNNKKNIPKVKKKVLFVEQNIIPGKIEDRIMLFNQIIDFASKNKEIEIIIKPRTMLDKSSLHQPEYHIENLIPKELPNNISINHDNIYELAKKINLVLTVSSTFAMESIMSGIPTCIIKEFTNENDFFYKSGLVADISEIKTFNKKINYKWFEMTKFIKNNNFKKSLINIINNSNSRMDEKNYDDIMKFIPTDRKPLLKQRRGILYSLLFLLNKVSIKINIKAFIKNKI